MINRLYVDGFRNSSRIGEVIVSLLNQMASFYSVG